MLTTRHRSTEFMSPVTPACHRLLRAWLALSLTLLASLPLQAEEEGVSDWLDRMSRAVETLNYRGTLVHVHGDGVDTLRIVHRADEQGVRQRIYALDGSPREVVRSDDSIRFILPGDEPLMLESQLGGRLLPTLPVSRLLGPDSGYRMTLGSIERVAGMTAQVIHIQPRDSYRYGSQLWLEERTGMLLRYALIDHDGNRLQQLSFTTLELGVSIPDRELEPELSGRQFVTRSVDEALRTVSHTVSVQPQVPRGYRLVNAGRGRGPDNSKFEHLLFSDGLSSFSIYIEAASAEPSEGQVEAMGPVHVFTTRLGGMQYTVIGEVPALTVDYVGRQLQRSIRASVQN